MGIPSTTRAALDFVTAHLSAPAIDSFAAYATKRYGRTIAERFLLNYTEKLWGAPCDRLSPVLTGGRLRGLGVRQLVLDAMWKARSRNDMEGSFLYPTGGIGMVPAALCEYLGREWIRANSRVTRILHQNCRISSIEINGEERVPVSTVLSTLPIDQVVTLLDPPPPNHIAHHTRHLTYRHIILVAFFLRKPSVTDAATVYFPDHAFPFTRVVEPRNRSTHMSPVGHTSLVAELPCSQDDEVWMSKNERLVRLVSDHLQRIGWFVTKEVEGTALQRLPRAYPVITVDSEKPLRSIKDYLARFRNLMLHGRNATFQYKWIHNLFHEAHLVVRDTPG
jgi:protoporphyrinogen oxidase